MSVRSETRLLGEEYAILHDSLREFAKRELLPRIEEFDEVGAVARDFWENTGRAGPPCVSAPEEYGGLCLDFRFNFILNEKLAYAGLTDSLTLQSDTTSPYFPQHASRESSGCWLPK